MTMTEKLREKIESFWSDWLETESGHAAIMRDAGWVVRNFEYLPKLFAAAFAESLLSSAPMGPEARLCEKCGYTESNYRHTTESPFTHEFVGAAPPAASPQPEFELEGSLGKVTVRPGQRFMDGNVLWEIVRKTGHGTYSPFGLGGTASVACKVVSGTPDGRFKNFAADGTLVWCGDSLASAVIAYQRTIPAASGSGTPCVHCHMPIETCQSTKWEAEVINRTLIHWRFDEQARTFVGEIPRMLTQANTKENMVRALKSMMQMQSHLFLTGELPSDSGSGTPATPSTPQLRPQVPEWDYESQHEREKAIMALQEKREHAAIAAALVAEREACAKIAEQYLDSAFCKESFYGQQVAKRIRSRASEPIPVSLSEAVWRTGGGSGQFRRRLGVKLGHIKDERYAALTQNPYDEEPKPANPAEGPAVKEGK